MAQVLIRNLDTDLVTRLKRQAQEHGRSLEAELRGILEAAVSMDLADARTVASRIRRRLAGRTHTDSADLQSADRRR
jgi:antitoxin FitA